MTASLSIGRDERVMVIAPHPDDDTLATGGLLLRAVDAGAAVRVVFATAGENNPWTQRVVERRWRIGRADRDRFGARRRAEALDALGRLGVPPDAAAFLGLPDQGISGLLLSQSASIRAGLLAPIETWRPTLLVAPSTFDLHPDHNALAVLVRQALAQLGPARAPARVIHYVVHGRGPAPDSDRAVRFALSDAEWTVKQEAIRCHATQLTVHRRGFLSPHRRVETFYLDDDPGPRAAAHPVRLACVEGDALRLELALRPRPGAFGRATLLLASVDAPDPGGALSVDLSWERRAAAIRRLADGSVVGHAALDGARRGGVVTLPLACLPVGGGLFAKVDRAVGFFDEAGWMEVAAATTPGATTVPQRAGSDGDGVCCVVPCYNVGSLCGDVVRDAAAHAARVIVVDDGSTDDTGRVLETIAAQSEGRIRLLSFETNRGKGAALLEAFRLAMRELSFDVIVTIDGDGQHRPCDIPGLVAACRRGADLVIGGRAQFGNMPPRSRFGNSLTGFLLSRLYPGSPADTQSGFRAIERRFLEHVVSVVGGRRYELEVGVLLLALAHRRPIAVVPIPTLYLEGNRSSHFRPLRDSLRIGATILTWWWSPPPQHDLAVGPPRTPRSD